MVLGAIIVSLIAATLLTFMWQPIAEPSRVTADQRLVREYDQQLHTVLNGLIAAAEIGPDGEVSLRNPLADDLRRFAHQ